MDIAVSAVILILLLLPAFTFRAFIIKSDSLENPLDTSNKAEFGLIFMFALIQHLFGYLCIKITNIYHVHFDQFYYILNGTSDKIQNEILISSFLPFLLYILGQVGLSIPAALFLKKLALKHFWDLRYNHLPISNEWDQLLSGRTYEYNRIKKINDHITELKQIRDDRITIIQNSAMTPKSKREEITSLRNRIKDEIKNLKNMPLPQYYCVEVDVLVNIDAGDMIYKGGVFKYYLAKDNSLDKLVLKNVYRRKFIDVKTAENQELEFYEFESTLFVINYAEIKNLNVRYTFVQEDTGPEEDDEENPTTITTTTTAI